MTLTTTIIINVVLFSILVLGLLWLLGLPGIYAARRHERRIMHFHGLRRARVRRAAS